MFAYDDDQATPLIASAPNPSEAEAAWNEIKGFIDELNGLKQDYLTAKEELENFEAEKKKIEEEFDKKIADAEEEAKAIFQSPFLLPAMWVLMLPNWVPFGGGFPPPPVPFPGPGPPSSFPGMIYIILLLIDAIEEKMHEDVTKEKDDLLNCEDEL
jgi:hypothetical protein